MQRRAKVALRAFLCWPCRSFSDRTLPPCSATGHLLAAFTTLLIPNLSLNHSRECQLNRHCPPAGARRPVLRHRTRAKRSRATRTLRPRSASTSPASSPACCRCCLASAKVYIFRLLPDVWLDMELKSRCMTTSSWHGICSDCLPAPATSTWCHCLNLASVTSKIVTPVSACLTPSVLSAWTLCTT